MELYYGFGEQILLNEVLTEEALENFEVNKIDGQRFTDFRYVDDTLRMADSETALQNIIYGGFKTLKTYGMAFSPKNYSDGCVKKGIAH